MTAGVARIGHIGLAVSDLDTSIAFYTGPLGLRLTERFEYPEEEVGHGGEISRGAFVRCDTTHHCISLFQPRLSRRFGDDAAPYGLHHVAFEVASPAELLGLYRQLVGHSVRIHDARKGGPGNQPRFYAYDPDGNLLEFYWGIDQIGWTGLARSYDPIESIDLEDFDFESYVLERDRAARAAQSRLSSAASEAVG